MSHDGHPRRDDDEDLSNKWIQMDNEDRRDNLPVRVYQALQKDLRRIRTPNKWWTILRQRHASCSYLT